jgi:anti-sigma B factor antagonist
VQSPPALLVETDLQLGKAIPVETHCQVQGRENSLVDFRPVLSSRRISPEVFRRPLIAGRNSDSFAKRSEAHVNIGIRKAGRATILDLDGPLKLGEAEESFRNQIQQLVEAGTTYVAVNLAGVTELDSSGIGALVRAFTTLKRAGGKCTYFAPNKRVIMLLKMVRLDTVLDLAADEATALTRI